MILKQIIIIIKTIYSYKLFLFIFSLTVWIVWLVTVSLTILKLAYEGEVLKPL